jgi:hypothetical protein
MVCKEWSTDLNKKEEREGKIKREGNLWLFQQK